MKIGIFSSLFLINSILTANSCIESINKHGAIPNDKKDDTKSILKALNLCEHITMKKGIYNVVNLIRLNKNTIIDGNNSTFKSKLDVSYGGRTSKNILTLKGNRIVIKNLLLDGAYTNGNSKEGDNVSSLLHIYDSNNILLDNVDTINYASNWWDSQKFNTFKFNSNHTIDMYHVIYIGFSNNIKIKNMEQRRNIKTEGLLIYESDNIYIDRFKSFNSPKIWTSLHIVASDNIYMNNVDVGDGLVNDGGSSINFIANHHFIIKNTKTTTKQGFDISNEINIKNREGRVTRDTSYGIFENCHFEGQRALSGYPSIQKQKDLVFKNTKFIPTKDGYATWGARIQKVENIKFENCTFGNKKFKTYGIILGDSDEISIKNSTFINPSIAVYLFGENFLKLNLENNLFIGDEYSPLTLFWLKKYGKEGILKKMNLLNNKTKGNLINRKLYNIKGDFKIEDY